MNLHGGCADESRKRNFDVIERPISAFPSIIGLGSCQGLEEKRLILKMNRAAKTTVYRWRGRRSR